MDSSVIITRNCVCDICEKIFSNNKYKQKHLQSVHGEIKNIVRHVTFKGHKNHKCNSCEKSFSNSGNIMRHIKTVHEGQRNYKCDSCGKCFSQSGTLKRHIKTHS